MASGCSSPGSARDASRTRVLMSVTLLTPAGERHVKVRDISSTGAHVIASDAMEKDCDVLFKRGSVFAAGRIVWSSGKEAGIKFYRNLSEWEVGN